MPTKLKPRTVQASDEDWDFFKDLAWKSRQSASDLFREWIGEARAKQREIDYQSRRRSRKEGK